MTIIIKDKDLSNLLVTNKKNDIEHKSKNYHEIIYNFPEYIASGYWQDINLYPGLVLSIWNLEFHDDVVFHMFGGHHDLEFIIQTQGSFVLNDDKSVSSGKSYLIGSGIAPKETILVQGLHRFEAINIHIEPQLLKSFFANQLEEFPHQLQPLLNDGDRQTRLPPQNITSAMQLAVEQILNCPHQGLTKKIYLQSKVIELLALQLEPLLETQTPNNKFNIKPEDIDCIYHAREIVVTRLENPPSLLELARLVGINDNKLKIGFRKVFGTTVFKYLHNYRIEKSRQLLEEGQMTVAEVAWAVGFAHRGYFATAFKRKFGVNPSVYLRDKRVNL